MSICNLAQPFVMAVWFRAELSCCDAAGDSLAFFAKVSHASARP